MTILNIQMTPAGVELVIAALRELPHKQVDGLVAELWAQYQAQVSSAPAVEDAAPDEAEVDADAA